MKQNDDDNIVRYMIQQFELQHPLPNGYSKRSSIIANNRDMYQKLASKSAKQLIRSLEIKNCSEVANVKYGAIFMGLGYYIGAILSNGEAIPITHQIRYEDTPVWKYDASQVLNISAVNFYYSEGRSAEEVDEISAEDFLKVETGLFLNWCIDPHGNLEIVNEVFKKICPPMIREVSSRMSGSSKKEIVLYVPPVSPSLDINWDVVFDGLTLENTTVSVMDSSVLFTPKESERLYKIYKHTWQFGGCFILQATETGSNLQTVCVGSSALIQDVSEHYYSLQPTRFKKVALHGSKPVGKYSLSTVNETKCNYCDQFVQSKFPTPEGTLSYLGSSAPLFYYDFFSLTNSGAATKHFESKVAEAFMGKTQQMKNICSKLCNEKDLQNIALGDMVAVGLALENPSIFQNTTISTKKEKLDLSTKLGLLPEIDISQLVSIPSNYASFIWKNRKKFAGEDYMRMDTYMLRSKPLNEQLGLMLSRFETETTENLAEELLYIQDINGVPTALFVARLFAFLCGQNEFVAERTSEIVQEFEVSSVFAREIPLPKFPEKSKNQEIKKTKDTMLQQEVLKKEIKYLNMSIEEMGFSIRTYNCLKRAKKNIANDLTKMTEEDYQKVRNLGSKSIQEIKAKLTSLGLSIKN